MTRAEHLEWAKERARQYLDAGDPANAVTSLLSDLTKHEELCGHPGIELGVLELFGGRLKTPDQIRRWVEGFA